MTLYLRLFAPAIVDVEQPLITKGGEGLVTDANFAAAFLQPPLQVHAMAKLTHQRLLEPYSHHKDVARYISH